MIEAMTIDGNGISVKSYREIRKEVADEFSSTFGSSLSLDPGTPDGALVDLLAYALSEVAQGAQSASANVDPATATGVFLDRLAEIAGLSRREGESDNDLRLRMKSATFDGLATYDSMLTYLRQKIAPTVTLSVNDGPYTADGIPGHSFVVAVPDGVEATDDGIAQAIWECKPAGISASGKRSGKATDASGASHEVRFESVASRAFRLRVSISEYDEETLPADYADRIRAALSEWAKGQFTAGKDVIPQRFVGPVFDACGGILSVSVETSADGASWTGEVVRMGAYECASFPEADISVERS